MNDTIEIKKTHTNHCQVCGKEFKFIEICYYAPIDNNIVCTECAAVHKDKQLRIYIKE